MCSYSKYIVLNYAYMAKTLTELWVLINIFEERLSHSLTSSKRRVCILVSSNMCRTNLSILR